MSDSKKKVKEVRSSPVSLEQGAVYRIALKPPLDKAAGFLRSGIWPLTLFAGWYVYNIFWNIIYWVALPGGLIGGFVGLLLLLSYFALISCLFGNSLVLNKRGMTVPLLYVWAASGRLRWKWSELISVVFSRSSPDQPAADQIILGFQQENSQEMKQIHIQLKEIDQLELKKLVYAIVSNAPHALIEPKLDEVALQFPTVSGIKHINFQSFTSLWDEEFSTRYSPTLFVPLVPDAELRNGSIRISELVACGGSAAIYAAKDSDGKQIIVKEAVIPKNSPDALKAKAIELFNREAMLLSRLNHPNIAKVLDHFVENEHHYEVIEFIDGLDLRRFVKERGPQPEDFVLNWAQQTCEILVYLHSQDPPVIHRDLTPDNLVLRVDGQLVLIDFGAANAFVGTATGTMVGKQSYMPPEQLRGKAVPQSDIYALGCTLYFLLTGRDPTPLEPSQIEKSDKLSMSLNPLLAKCTAIEAGDRFQSAVELLEAIRATRKQRLFDAVSERSR